MLRIDKARELLKRQGLDALLLFSPTDWRYYGGWGDARRHCLGNRRWNREPDPIPDPRSLDCNVTLIDLFDVLAIQVLLRVIL